MALSGALGYIGLADPHDPASIYPPCPFKWLTGWNCPFCGGLRMTHDLLHGDLWAAVHDNVFLLAAVPTLAAFLLVRRARGRRALPAAAVPAVVVATLVWTVLRNLPAFPPVSDCSRWVTAHCAPCVMCGPGRGHTTMLGRRE